MPTICNDKEANKHNIVLKNHMVLNGETYYILLPIIIKLLSTVFVTTYLKPYFTVNRVYRSTSVILILLNPSRCQVVKVKYV